MTGRLLARVVLLVVVLAPAAAVAEGGLGAVATEAILSGTVRAVAEGADVWLPHAEGFEIEAASATGVLHSFLYARAYDGGSNYVVLVRRWYEPVSAEGPVRIAFHPTGPAVVRTSALAFDTTRIAIGVTEEARWITPRLSYALLVEVEAGAVGFVAPQEVRAESLSLILPAGRWSGDLAGEAGERHLANGGTVFATNSTVLVLNFTDAVVRAPGAVTTASVLRADVDGSATFPAATGFLEAGEGFRLARDKLTIDGTFRVTAFAAHRPPAKLAQFIPVGPEGQPRFAVSGAFDRVQLNDLTILSTERAVAAVGGAALLAFLLWLYSRLGRRDVLAHPTRAAILGLVESEPGIVQQRVQDRLGLGWGTFRHHLRVLVRSRLLRRTRHGRYWLLHTRAIPLDPLALAAARGRALDVYDFLAENPGASAGEVGAALRIPRQLADYHLRALRQLGLVRGEGARPTRWEAKRRNVGGHRGQPL